MGNKSPSHPLATRLLGTLFPALLVTAAVTLQGCSREDASSPAAADTSLKVAVPASAENPDGTVPWKGCVPLTVSVVSTSSGVAVPVTCDTIVSLAASGPASYQPASVYSDAACLTTTSVATIKSGTSSATAYVKTPVKGQFAIDSAAPGYPSVPRLVVSAN